MNQSDRKSLKRPNIQYCVNALYNLHKDATIHDEDCFFKTEFPTEYKHVQAKIDEINASIYVKTEYNGKWLIDTFELRPGPVIGQVLKALSDKYGEKITEHTPDEVKDYVVSILGHRT